MSRWEKIDESSEPSSEISRSSKYDKITQCQHKNPISNERDAKNRATDAGQDHRLTSVHHSSVVALIHVDSWPSGKNTSLKVLSFLNPHMSSVYDFNAKLTGVPAFSLAEDICRRRPRTRLCIPSECAESKAVTKCPAAHPTGLQQQLIASALKK
jgi:hypothetical protein